MIEKAYSRPVVPVLAAFISGILSGARIPGYHAIALGLIGLAAVIIIIQIFRRNKAAISPIVLFFSLGYLSIQPWTPQLFPPDHAVHLAGSSYRIITGVIGDPIKVFTDRKRFDIHALHVAADDHSTPLKVSGKIRVTVAGDSPTLATGDTVSFSGRIRLPHNFNNPGGFDYKRYMAYQGIWGTTYIPGKKITLLVHPPGRRFVNFISATRQHIAGFINTFTHGTANAVLKALIIGDRNAISAATRDAFNRTGAGHLLAISGLHVGIVATIAYFLLYRLLGFCRPLLWRGWSRKAAAILCLLPVWFYGLLAGMSPSTQRAVIMVSIFLMAFLLEREQDSLNTLAVAALSILVWHPPTLFSISFQLSFAAVSAILFGYACLQSSAAGNGDGLMPSVWIRLGQKLLSAILVSLFAICGTLPLVMYYFNQISTVGLFTNLITVPLIGFVVVPLGLLSLIVLPISAVGASWCLHLSAAVLDATLMIIYKIAQLPFAAFKTFTPSVFEIGCYYILGWAVLNILRSHRTAQLSPSATTGRRRGRLPAFNIRDVFLKNSAAITVVIVFFAITGDAWYWYSTRFLHKDLRVTVIDVGQGFSALVELPRGHNILVDGGGFSDNSRFDIGARVIAPLLWYKKIKTVDTLILSHPNSDHLNGLIYIAKHFNVKNIWTNGEKRDTIGYRHLMEAIAAGNIHHPKFSDMSRNFVINGVEISFLYPPDGFLEQRKHQKWRNTNNNSLVVKMNYGSHSFLFPGDIMKSGEQELTRIAGEQLDSAVLIAPHHGSRTSSTDLLLDQVRPEVVVISAGWMNPRKFPHPKVSANYKRRGYQVYRTDQHGAVVLATDGDSISIEPMIGQSFKR